MTTMAVVAPLVGWLIPGAGHILLHRYVRGILLMASVVGMFLIGLGMDGRIYKPNGGDILDILGFVGDVGAGSALLPGAHPGLGPRIDRARDRGLRHEVLDRGGIAELYRGGRRSPHRAGEETVTITLSHFSAAVLFALFASVVFGITQRNTVSGTGPLRALLLRHVRRRSDRRRVGDVDIATVAAALRRQTRQRYFVSSIEMI